MAAPVETASPPRVAARAWGAAGAGGEGRGAGLAGADAPAGRDGVPAEGGGDDLCGLEAGLEGAASGFADDGVEDEFARFHDAAAEDDALDVEEVDDGGDGRADVAA